MAYVLLIVVRIINLDMLNAYLFCVIIIIGGYMKKRLNFLFVVAIILCLFVVVPVVAMEGTDGTGEAPVNRTIPGEDGYEAIETTEFDLDHAEIETGEGYENIVPLTAAEAEDVEEEDDRDLLPLILAVSGATVAVVLAIALLIIRKNR